MSKLSYNADYSDDIRATTIPGNLLQKQNKQTKNTDKKKPS